MKNRLISNCCRDSVIMDVDENGNKIYICENCGEICSVRSKGERGLGKSHKHPHSEGEYGEDW